MRSLCSSSGGYVLAAALLGSTLGVAGRSDEPAKAPEAEKLPKRVSCPVDGRAFDATAQSPMIRVNGSPRYFCTLVCRDRFVLKPEPYVKETVYCTVQKSQKGWILPGRRVEVNNGLYYLC